MRNNGRETYFNETEEYKEIFAKKNLRGVRQYLTPKLKSVSPEDYKRLSFVYHTWKTGDRFYKLANEYYNDSKFWWIIALFNEKPTEFHFKPGDTVVIPTPLTQVLTLIEYS